VLLETRRPRCFGLLDIPSTTRERGLCARGQTVRATRVDAAPPTDAATDAGFASSLSRSEPSITGQWTHLHTRPRSPPLYALPPVGLRCDAFLVRQRSAHATLPTAHRGTGDALAGGFQHLECTPAGYFQFCTVRRFHRDLRRAPRSFA
jgi:hypothetical protein